jgi:hypothetical protein
MFQENSSHLQTDIFGLTYALPKSKQEKLEKSREFHFYNIFFCSIDETIFSVLYSELASRPNAPVNILVAALLLQNSNGWSITELLNRIDFDFLTRTALGLKDLNETPFCEASYYNFQNRILAYAEEHGENLVEKLFDNLTTQQLKSLKIKTNIQRMDSFQAISNIRKYNRTELLIEVLLRLHRALDDSDKETYKEILSPYLSQSSSRFVYDLSKTDFPKAIGEISEIYKKLYEELKNSHSTLKEFEVFSRVYKEHFVLVDEKIEVISGKEMGSGTLQSPDDLDATYRSKRNESFQGAVVNVTETANPENDINLITDVTVAKNNVDDSVILNDRIDSIVEKTPDLEELHTDGAYGSSENDRDLAENDIKQIPTAVRGRKSEVEITIDNTDDPEVYEVACPNQTVKSNKTSKRNKACFDNSICSGCEHKDSCQTLIQKKYRVLYFTDEDAEKSKRNRNIFDIPIERRKIRPNVEATMKEFTRGFNHKGKLKVRGAFKTSLFAILMSLAINFGRIYRASVV